jgi:transglutaminase-like putative cysteine protease
VSEFLPRAVLLRLLGVLAIVLLPHLTRFPVWESLFLATIVVYRLLATLRQWRPLNRWGRAALTLGSFGAIYASFGNIAGQSAGTALLAAMACLKLTELNSRRDMLVMVLLLYFLLITHFLFSQEMWTVAYLLVCAVLITALLVEANHPDSALPLRVPLRTAGRLVAQALPLMLLLFVLFPRVPGPLWGLPSDAGAAQSGLPDEMQPGDIQNLIENEAVAFRVHFNGPVPPPELLYWRGPVLSHFDGKKWDAGVVLEGQARPWEVSGEGYAYEITLEPQRRRWLLALDLPDSGSVPADASITASYQLVARNEVRERRIYRLVSHPHYRIALGALSPVERYDYLQLPQGYNPRTLALARRWREEGKDDTQIIAALLEMFRGKDFYYTLSPPKLGRNSVDEFLFDTHRGFCEHYAGSFATLMRAAGIPARVVTGYQGATRNEVGGYYVVQQSDAHAWTEVWLEGRGWTRIDPTAAVAPSRVDKGIGAALEGSGSLPAYLDPSRRGFHMVAMIKARLDWVDDQWNHWVLGYGPDVQQQVLSRLGLDDWSNMILALTFGTSIVLGLLSALLARQFLPRRETDPVQAQWLKLRGRLRRAGLEQAPGEGPRDFSGRVAQARPELAEAMQRACGLYLRLRYLETAEPALLRELNLAVAALRP